MLVLVEEMAAEEERNDVASFHVNIIFYAWGCLEIGFEGNSDGMTIQRSGWPSISNSFKEGSRWAPVSTFVCV